jgi:hypothetical protein
MQKCSGRRALRFPPRSFSAPPSRRRPRPGIIASPILIRQFTTWPPPPLVTAARHLVVHLAAALVRGLALVHRQIAGEQSFGLKGGHALASTLMPGPMRSACGLLHMPPEFIAHSREQLVGECRLAARAEAFIERGRKDRSRHRFVDCSLDRPASFPRI